MEGFHYGAHEANFEEKESGMRGTVAGGRWVVVIASEQRIGGNRWGGS
jgi:uncharacterized protein YheU (UPF0270 family)